jgi:Acyl-coenzyme A:6-aminopenicillanic acid acyl-transferase
VLVVLLGACAAPAPTAQAPAAQAPAAAGGGQRGQALGDDAARTLGSLRKLDSHPLYVMRYHGDYDPRVAFAARPSVSAAPWGCSLFVAGGDPAHPVFGRNFDWDDNPALLLFTDPPDGYASVSMVDISYLGFSRSRLPDAAGERERLALLDAPLLPFDGMNEHGLAVGMAAVDGSVAPRSAARPTVSGVRVIRLMLDEARTVEEALAVIDRHNLDWSGGPPLHYLLADAAGDAAVVEFVDGRTHVHRKRGPWIAATNFLLTGADERERQADGRYRTASGQLRQAKGALTADGALRLLESIAQPHTRWSVVYGLRSGDVRLVTGRRYGTVHDFRLALSG